MFNNIIVRLLFYYITWLVILNSIFHFYPQILHYVAQGEGAHIHRKIPRLRN